MGILPILYKCFKLIATAWIKYTFGIYASDSALQAEWGITCLRSVCLAAGPSQESPSRAQVTIKSEDPHFKFLNFSCFFVLCRVMKGQTSQVKLAYLCESFKTHFCTNIHHKGLLFSPEFLICQKLQSDF